MAFSFFFFSTKFNHPFTKKPPFRAAVSNRPAAALLQNKDLFPLNRRSRSHGGCIAPRNQSAGPLSYFL
ncbi:MAG TPA: hypothetical protein DC013_01490 [Ruminococcaceae bacterium]|jgi:hypothetical protein|nr:hypothetical protein [Oscillospiraceae bacterium]